MPFRRKVAAMTPRASKPARKTAKKTGKTTGKTTGKSPGKTAGKTAKKTAKPVQLAKPSPRSGVQLPVGAHPGNTGGKAERSGRPPSEIRERLRGSFDQRVVVLEQIADDLKGTAADRTRAIELMARYGLGQEHTIRLEGFAGAQQAFLIIERCIVSHLPRDTAEEIIALITEELRAL